MRPWALRFSPIRGTKHCFFRGYGLDRKLAETKKRNFKTSKRGLLGDT